jgi:hypothetical protein
MSGAIPLLVWTGTALVLPLLCRIMKHLCMYVRVSATGVFSSSLHWPLSASQRARCQRSLPYGYHCQHSCE